MTTIDTNVIVRHLVGDPPQQAKRATAFLARAEDVVLTDLVAAEVVYVLESFYEVERPVIVDVMRSLLSMRSVQVDSQQRVLRAVELYERHKIGFADAYIAAVAEERGVTVTSFDKGLDKITSIDRAEP